MAGQGLGEFAGSFGQAFTQARQHADSQKEKKKFAKLQAQLIEMQLNQAETVQDAQTKIKDMMSPTQTSPGGRESPNFVAPPEGQIEEFTQGRDINQMLKDPEGLASLLASGQLDLGDLLQNQGRTADRDQTSQMLGLLTGGGDGGLGGGSFVPVGGSLSARGPQLDFGINPQNTPLGVDDSSAFVAPDTGAPMPPGRTAQQNLDAGAITQGQFTVRQNLVKTGVDIETTFHKYQEALSLMKDLEGTFSASGVPFGDTIRMTKGAFAAAGAAAGFNTQDMATQNAKRDRLKKILASGMLGSIDQLADAGTMTNAKFAQLQASTADLGNEADANARVFADILEASIQGADQIGAKFEGRSEMEKFIKDIRGGSVTNNAEKPEVVVDMPGAISAVSQMTVEQLDALGQQKDKLTIEIKRAMADRWEQLNAAKK